MTSAPLPIVSMPHLRVISVSGADAGRFLQAQLSRDVLDLKPDESRLAGWHDARGRVRAVFRILLSHDRYLLTAPADLAEQLCAALKMYVLRANVGIELTDLACAGAAIAPKTAHASETALGLPATVNAVADSDQTLVVCVAPGCWHFIGVQATALNAKTSEKSPIDAAEIRAGLPNTDARTTGKYVAHMLNLERLGAVDFDKGCFPGQEVIARTEHLGQVKRRARCFAVSAAERPPQSETPVVDAHGNPIGTVLRSAQDCDGRIFILAVVALDALDAPLYLDAGVRRPLEHIPLPFE